MRSLVIIITMLSFIGCSKVVSPSEFNSQYGNIVKTKACITEAYTDQNKIVQYIDTPKGKQILWVGKIKK